MRGHIRKRGSKWVIIVEAGRDENGRRTQRWHSGFETKRDATAALTEILGRMQRNEYVTPSNVTVGDWVKQWLAQVNRRPATQAMYEMLATNYIIPALGPIRVQELTPSQCNGLYRELELKGGIRGTLSSKSIRHVHSVLRAAMNAAVAEGIVHRNVVCQAKPPRLNTPEMKTWTASELRAFLNAIADNRLFPAFLTLASTGLRRGELLGLRWRDLDLDGANLQVRQSLVVANYAVTMSPPKTEKARRLVALDPDTVEALRGWRARVLEERIAVGIGAPQPDDLVFVQEDASALHPSNFAKRFRKLVNAIGLPRIRLHDLRHTHASLALQAGVHVKVVSERLGHSSVGITLDTYSHAIPAMDADAAVRVMEIVKTA